jgi:hypothetical protein
MGVNEFIDKIYNDARVLKELGSTVTEVQMTVVFLKGLVPELDAVKDLILNEDVAASNTRPPLTGCMTMRSTKAWMLRQRRLQK